jgi:two-component system chemotaxis sensor kinase CheA
LAAEPDAVRGRLPSGGQTELVSLSSPGTTLDLPATARAVLEAQSLMLADPTAEPAAGRAGAARRTAANVLRNLGRPGDADRFAGIELNLVGSGLDDLLAGAFPSAAPTPDALARTAPEAVTRALRVDVERIDALVKLTGELTVAKNALAHAAALAQAGTDAATLAGLLKTQHGQLDRLVNELQRSVLNIRVLPLRQVFQRFPRLVREMVGSLGKPARLVTEGDDTEADKAVVEALFEPLLHVLRNALDHGVEPAEARSKAGKPPSATIKGGEVVAVPRPEPMSTTARLGKVAPPQRSR